jgi:hypothetical protein
MKASESINELASALCNAQGQMGGAVKDSANPFFKSSYADLTSVIKAIKQPFADNGLSYTQFPVTDENGMGVCTRLMHVSGQWLEGQFTLPVVKRDPQAASSSLTYARRVSLSSIAGIPTADDDAESAMLRGDDKKIISDDQIIAIKKLLDETGADSEKFCKWLKVRSVDQILDIHYDRAVAALEAKK